MPASDAFSRVSLADLDLLTQISSMLTSLDRDHVLEHVIELAARAVGAERSSLLLHPQHRDEWMPVVYRYTIESSRGERLAEEAVALHLAQRVFDQGLAGWVSRERQGTIVADTRTDERWIEFSDSPSGARSALCVPFIYEGQILGVVTMLHSQPDHFSTHDLQLLTIVVNQATVALRNAQLFLQMGQQKRRLEGILQAMPDTLLVLDQQGRIVLVNLAAAQFLDPGRASGEFVGLPLTDFARDDEVLTTVQGIVSAAQDAQLGAFEARSSGHHDFLVTVAAWEAEPGSMAGYVVVMRDVTQLRDLNRFKDEMLQMASHDLRSPLALIVGYCDLIAMDTSTGSPIHEYLDIIQRSTERMRNLLDDLLKVEQIRNSPLELNEQVDYRTLIMHVLVNMRPSSDKRHQTLTEELHLDDLPSGIVLNPMLIREAMENLISNAIKYTSEGGTITVRSWTADGRVYFEVQDTGIGIPKSALPRLFESFYRVRQKGTEKVEGRGLGLSLVKTVVERHQGQVWVDSEEGKGSRFGFWLPIVTQQLATH